MAGPCSAFSAVTAFAISPPKWRVFCHAGSRSVFENTTFGAAFMRAAPSGSLLRASSLGQ
jgi:hypothetical protein